MGERTRFWLAAALVAALGGFGAAGCKSSNKGTTEGPPPETTYNEPGTVTDGGGTGEAGSHEASHDPNTIPIVVEWEGEGEGRTAKIDVEGQAFSPSAEVSEDLVSVLKARKTQIAEQGYAPQVKISAPTDMQFDAVIEPIMMASFKAGFGISDVHYEPRMPK